MIDSVIGLGGSTIVVDLKISSKRLSKFQVDNNDQLTAYYIGAKSLGFEPDKYRLDVLVKASSPDLVIYETVRGERDQARFLKKVTRIWKPSKHQSSIPSPTGTALRASGRGIVWTGEEEIEEDRNEPGW